MFRGTWYYLMVLNPSSCCPFFSGSPFSGKFYLQISSFTRGTTAELQTVKFHVCVLIRIRTCIGNIQYFRVCVCQPLYQRVFRRSLYTCQHISRGLQGTSWFCSQRTRPRHSVILTRDANHMPTPTTFLLHQKGSVCCRSPQVVHAMFGLNNTVLLTLRLSVHQA